MTVVSWDAPALKLALHYCGFQSSRDIVVDLNNPVEASRLRPHQASSKNADHEECQNASGTCEFAPREEPFKFWQVKDPKAGQTFQWRFKDSLYATQVCYAHGTRIVFCYEDWTSYNTCVDFKYEALVPSEAAGHCTFEQVVLTADEGATFMVERTKLRELHSSRGNQFLPIPRESLENAQPGQTFMVPNDTGYYDLAFFESFSDDTLVYKKLRSYDGKHENEKMYASWAQAKKDFVKFSQRGFLFRGEVDLSFPVPPIDYDPQDSIGGELHPLPLF